MLKEECVIDTSIWDKIKEQEISSLALFDMMYQLRN